MEDVDSVQVDLGGNSKSPTTMEHTTRSVPPLAPLEYLQSQRKGSITDPALHAHANAHNSRPTSPYVSSDRRTHEAWPSQRRASSMERGGVGSVIAGSPRVSNGVEFAWPSHGHHLAGMENEASNNKQLSNPIHQNIPYPQQPSVMSSITFEADRKDVQGEPSSGPVRSLRSRSRPPSRQIRRAGDPSSGDNTENPSQEPSPDGPKPSRDAATPYSRSPELRVSHKLAERKRRKEMKDLFDELREQLPADRGMKASKWEILSKAIDFVAQLKQSHQEMVIELERLRREMDSVRGGVPAPYGPSGPIYGQGSVVSHSYPPPPPARQLSRPPSSQSTHFPLGAGPAHQSPKGSPDGHCAE